MSSSTFTIEQYRFRLQQYIHTYVLTYVYVSSFKIHKYYLHTYNLEYVLYEKKNWNLYSKGTKAILFCDSIIRTEKIEFLIFMWRICCYIRLKWDLLQDVSLSRRVLPTYSVKVSVLIRIYNERIFH